MVLANIDTLIFTCNVEGDYNEVMDYTLTRLGDKQSTAKLSNKNEYITFDTVSFNIEEYVTFELLPNGARNYKFILHNNSYEIKLANHYNPKSSNYPIYVKLKSEYLWLYQENAYYHCIKVLEDIFDCTIGKVKISRADLCCHTDEIYVTEMKIDQFVTRSNNHEEYYSSKVLETIQFGKSPILARIYDKFKEVNAKGKKKWFYDIWVTNGADLTNIVNVEFELKREFMKLYNIEEYEDLKRELKSIWHYLTCDWLVHKELTRSRLERCPVSNGWQKIQAAFDEYQSIDGITRQVQRHADEQHILHMISAYMLTHASLKGETDMMSYLTIFLQDISRHYKINQVDFKTEVLKKIQLG